MEAPHVSLLYLRGVVLFLRLKSAHRACGVAPSVGIRDGQANELLSTTPCMTLTTSMARRPRWRSCRCWARRNPNQTLMSDPAAVLHAARGFPSGHANHSPRCPLLRVKRTSVCPLTPCDAPYCPAVRIACAVCVPLASAASTVPISRPAYNASPEKNTVPASNFRSAVCASRVLGVA